MKDTIPDLTCSVPDERCLASDRHSSETTDTATVGSGNTFKMGTPFAALKLLPISPESSQRYERRRTIEERFTECAVQPLSRSFLRDPPVQWSPHRHPEGGLYFAHEQQRIFTDSYLYDKDILAQITSAVNQLLARPDVHRLLRTDSSHIDIVLDLMEETPENNECGYYFVDHSARIIFWLDVFNMSKLRRWKSVPGIQTPSHLTHLELALETEYWLAELFRKIIQELRGTIMYSIADAMTSSTTTLPFSVEHMFRMLTLTTEMMSELISVTDESNGVKMDPGTVAVLAIERFHHFHGEKTARLDKRQSVYGYSPKRSYLITCLSPLLFNAPLNHLCAIEDMHMDQLINYTSWHKLITRLRSEWHDLILYGTLILNTNVGFLAIPTIGSSAAGDQSAAHFSCYLSICFGLGSIILGLILLRLYRLEVPDAPIAGKAYLTEMSVCEIEFFRRHRASVFGLEGLSIVYSLPYALMIWGYAFLITVFQTSSVEMRGIALATVFTVCLAIMGSIWTEKRFVWNQKISKMRANIQFAVSRIWDGCLTRSGEEEQEQKLPGTETV
ncbi:hypothetical protein B0H10DRAFT_2185741 [Mycena sp. CBHHK59/15]|nr:hypothetical protein B0H10DRAFT_2185741 [Mycena sp. CBHHK59/15]